MKTSIRVVIGANYGDEGKGMVTSLFAKENLSINNLSTFNVLYNGGPQRGHTVQNHVYHAFGSGLPYGAKTLYTSQFLVNPIAICDEANQLVQEKIISDYPCLYIEDRSLLTLPHDIAINRAIERKRSGNKKHGSCGMGIWETVKRSEIVPVSYQLIYTPDKLYDKIKILEKKYYPRRLQELGLDESVFDFSLDDYIRACNDLANFCTECNFFRDSYIHTDNNLIFEGGQGLLLSNDCKNPLYTTPSVTGSNIISNKINAFSVNPEKEIEVCYVTRSYMTRHGNGPFPTQCFKEDINPNIEDKTNIPNEFQGSIRYGYLNVEDLIKRINEDFANYNPDANIKKSIAITHLNYTQGRLCVGPGQYLSIDSLKNFFDRIYISFEKDDMIRWK